MYVINVYNVLRDLDNVTKHLITSVLSKQWCGHPLISSLREKWRNYICDIMMIPAD